MKTLNIIIHMYTLLSFIFFFISHFNIRLRNYTYTHSARFFLWNIFWSLKLDLFHQEYDRQNIVHKQNYINISTFDHFYIFLLTTLCSFFFFFQNILFWGVILFSQLPKCISLFYLFLYVIFCFIFLDSNLIFGELH